MLKHLPFPLLALLAACEVEPLPPDPRDQAVPLPADVCAKVKEGLDELQSRGAITYTATGEATIEQEAWFRMPDALRENFAKSLGVHAACQAPTPVKEQSVTIRNEEGAPLLQRVVTTSANLGDILGKDGS